MSVPRGILVMSYIELKVIPAFKNKLLHIRYDDDCFVFFRSKKIMNEFFNILNNAHDSTSFTMEKKELVFLDVQVKREEDRFLTSVYKNKTFTDFYLNFQSNCS